MHTLAQAFRGRGVVSCRPEEDVLSVARRMCDASVGAIVVLEGDALVGIFSERDLMTRVVVAHRDPADTPVSAVMTRDVHTAAIEDRVDACEEKMRRAGCRHLPVLAKGRVIGMISMRDLLRDELEEERHDLRELRAYLHQAPLD
jgi:signal-transduction protein with cAMP-binding, CBS, and nucleotidyltransferase domain